MATTQKEFMVGCLVGSLIGAAAAFLIPKRYLTGLNGHKTKSRHADQRDNSNHVHATHPTAKKYMAKKPSRKKVNKPNPEGI